MVGRVDKAKIMFDPLRMFKNVPDIRTILLWFRQLRHDRRSHAMLAAVAHELERDGVHLIDSTYPIPDQMAGNGVMTIANGTLPLYFFGAGGYGMRQGLLMMPARLLQAGAPFLFDVLLTRVGTAALTLTAAFGIASFTVLSILRAMRPADPKGV